MDPISQQLADRKKRLQSGKKSPPSVKKYINKNNNSLKDEVDDDKDIEMLNKHNNNNNNNNNSSNYEYSDSSSSNCSSDDEISFTPQIEQLQKDYYAKMKLIQNLKNKVKKEKEECAKIRIEINALKEKQQRLNSNKAKKIKPNQNFTQNRHQNSNKNKNDNPVLFTAHHHQNDNKNKKNKKSFNSNPNGFNNKNKNRYKKQIRKENDNKNIYRLPHEQPNHANHHNYKNHNNHINNNHNNINTNDNKVNQAGSEQNISAPSLLHEEKERIKQQQQNDHEIAMQLQRQFEREQKPRRVSPQRIRPHQQQNINFHSPQPIQHQRRQINKNISTINIDGQEIIIGSYGDEEDESSEHHDEEEEDESNEHGFSAQDFADFHELSSNRRNNRNAIPESFRHFHSSPFQSSLFDTSSINRIHQRQVQDVQRMFNGRNANSLRMNGLFNSYFEDPFDNLSHDQLLQMFPNQPRPAKENTIQRLPVNTFNDSNNNSNSNSSSSSSNNNNKNKKDDNDKQKCLICLEEFKSGDQFRRLPCLHIFHKEEIDKWLRQNRVCPICRISVEQPQ